MRDSLAGRSRRWRARLLLGAGCAALLLIAFMVAAAATDRPSFCDTCHEMTPYVTAWEQGPHADTSCVECHVNSGRWARIAHKFVALREVVIHVRGTARFPLASPPAVPDSRCTRCHGSVTVDIPGFVHGDHAALGPCVMCHSTTGHTVTVEALQAAGIYSGYSQPTTDTAAIAVVDAGAADLPGHVDVTCSRCHIMSKTPCSACHAAPSTHAGWRGECSQCHAVGNAFVFTHPAGSGCTSCHTAPANHTGRPGECSQCHAVGDAFVFTHPAGSGCASCHSAPANHYGTNCVSCHSASRAWSAATFRHPAIPGGEHTYRSFECVNCHPNGYASNTCAACHESASGPIEDD